MGTLPSLSCLLMGDTILSSTLLLSEYGSAGLGSPERKGLPVARTLKEAFKGGTLQGREFGIL